MHQENLEGLFEELRDSFDQAEPEAGHRERFIARLNPGTALVKTGTKTERRWKIIAIAASLTLLLALGIGIMQRPPTMEQQLARFSPEISESQLYFASLIEEQVKELQLENTPETEQLIEDTLLQMKKLEMNYQSLEKELLNGGNSKLILSAMITNFQTRMDLLRDVMNKINTIKNYKSYTDENITI
jgi:hypothetical protein